jgi:hypothetical protein
MRTIHWPPLSPRVVSVSPHSLYSRHDSLGNPPMPIYRHRERLSSDYSALRPHSAPLDVVSTAVFTAVSLYTIDATTCTLASSGSTASSWSPSFPARASKHKIMKHENSRTSTIRELGSSATTTGGRHCCPEGCGRLSKRRKEDDGQQSAVSGIHGQEARQSV